MENLEKTRNQTDGIILFILSKGLRHIDELKQIIDEKFSSVKIGTLYSIITRLKTQKYITETRASSIDGSRRKYFSLTDLGRKVFEEKYQDLYNSVELNNSNFAPETFITKQPKKIDEPKVDLSTNEDENTVANETVKEEIVNETQSKPTYEEIIKNADFTSDFIDFSTIENSDENLISPQPIIELNEKNSISKTEKVEQKQEYKQESFLSYTDNFDYQENKTDTEDFDSVINSKYEYNSVLSKLFPKTNANKSYLEPSNNEESQTNNQTNETQSTKIKPIKQTWNDAYELAEKEGIKIRTSSDTNRYQGNKILFNKLQLITSVILFVLACFEYAILTLFFGIEFNLSTFIKVLIIFGLVLLTTFMVYLLYPNYKIKDLPKFINVLEIAIILAISTLVICFAISAIIEIDYSNVSQIFNVIVLPTVISLNVIVFFVIEYAISKLEIFQTI